jgi:diguanylate cyclase (GGDEF)-like protein
VGADRGKIVHFDGNQQVYHHFQIDHTDRNWNRDLSEEGAFSARQTGKPLFMNAEQMLATGLDAYEWLVQIGIRSYLSAPLKSGDATVGVISVAKYDDAGFTPYHAEYLMTFGRLVASQAGLMQQARHTARLAETDMLTGVANRARLMRVLNGPGALHEPDSAGRVIGALHIDLDHFKEVNDSLGHAVGDAILRHAADMMRAVVGPKDLVARTGGDEFVVITRSDPKGAHLQDLGEKIAAAVSTPIKEGDVVAQVGASIGTALAGPKDKTADRLIANADIALYQVKRAGRGGVRAYSTRMRAEAERRLRLLSDLHEAVKNQEFIPYFQPQVSMATGHFSGFETLARWRHPRHGIIDPANFIELSAEAGLSEQIDRIVREKGLVALRKLRDAGWNAPRMSFNAGARTLANRDLVQQLVSEVLTLDLDPGDLVVEVRETDLCGPMKEATRSNLAALSAAGFKIELDDFGAGFATLSTLTRMSISALKIDETVIAPLPGPEAETMVRAILALAAELGIQVVAEGVETPAQFAILRKLGCDFAQGFGVSKPMPLDGLIDFMEGYGQAPVDLAIPQALPEEVTIPH